jgi:uncharacterized membrane protein YgcG
MRKKTKTIALLGLTGMTMALATSLVGSTGIGLVATGDNGNVISSSESTDWYHNKGTEKQGSWSSNDSTVSVDAFGGNYAMEGATYLSKKGIAYGAYSFETLITISELNSVQNPEVGIIPWYVDEDNYLYLEMKFTTKADYLVSAEEKADGYALEQIVFSGRYDGKSKYVTATSEQENTVFDSLTVSSLAAAKAAPKSASGHKLKVTFENNSATATNYKVTISYNDVTVGSTYAYYYNAVPKNLAVGFMAQDVKATFSSAIIDDFEATNTSASLARDWKNKNDFTYKIQNGTDVWNFNNDGGVSFTTDEVKNSNNKTISQYKVSGTNIAGYDTNRGYTTNPNKETEDGLPQNYEVSASFKLDETPTYSGSKTVQGYGLLAWFQDDQNFIDVTFRRTVSGLEAAPTIKNELVLYGWIDCSSLQVGENIYDLGDSFDFSVTHTLKVEKKSTGFYVYLDDATSPCITKKVAGTDINYYYGYTGYNAKFSASALTSNSIYEAYDEITVLDDTKTAWRVSGQSKDAWSFSKGTISLTATDAKNRSYLLGTSEVSDRNMTVEAEASLVVGSGYSEFLLSPYEVDDNNYARLGLVVDGGKTYAYIRAASYTEDDMDQDKDPRVLVRRFELKDVSLSGNIKMKAEKIDTTLALYLNDQLVYGVELTGIDQTSSYYGIYAANLTASITSLTTSGYKRYSSTKVGDWTTSGMKYNEWTIDNDGYLSGDGTYSSSMEVEEKDAEKNFALKENTIGDDYEMTVEMKATAQSQAEDRVGVVMWYVDENNFMIFYLDRWRQDSTVPRTTIYGRIDGETLPTTYNHGGWLAEGDNTLDSGLTQTEASQVTEWHTFKIVKEGNTFTCYIDTETNGYISYTVAAGLPDTTGKKVYSGLYTYNDAVLVKSYNVDKVGGFTTASTPCPSGSPYNASVQAPVLGTYADSTTTDHYDGTTDNIANSGSGSSSSAPNSGDSSSSSSSSSGSSSSSAGGTTSGGGCGGGCGGSIAGTGIMTGVALIGVCALAIKRKHEKE